MDFNEFIEWLSGRNKVEFIYQGKYYNFVCNIDKDGQDYMYIVMSNGMIIYNDWIIISRRGSVEQGEKGYIEFVKNMKIDDIILEDIINKKLYEKNTLRKINGVVKNPYYHRNTNTIAEILYFNYGGLEAYVEYFDIMIEMGGKVNPDKSYKEADDADYVDLYLFIGPSGVKGSDQVEDIYDIKLSEVLYICFVDINEFYIYLNQVKIEGILVRDILEQELFEGVGMAI